MSWPHICLETSIPLYKRMIFLTWAPGDGHQAPKSGMDGVRNAPWMV